MMVQYVIPVVQPPENIPAVETWDTNDILIVDNTTLGLWAPICNKRGWTHITFNRNIGVAASWNLGAHWAIRDSTTFVAYVSSSVMWDAGLATFGAVIVEGGDSRGLLTDQSFHATAWNTRIFSKIGFFDESFYPAYMEDIDWLRRLELSGLHVPPERADAVGQPANVLPKWIPKARCEDAVTLKSGFVQVDFARNQRIYTAKWGGPKHEETFTSPYGLYVPLSYAPTWRDW